MSKKQEATNIFYTLFVDFLNDLSFLKPNDTTLFLAKNAISLINKDTLVLNFMDYIKDIQDKILDRDESFFLNDKNFHKQYINNDSFVSSEFDRIKDIWFSKETSDESKDMIWNYLISLIRFGKIATK